MAFFLTAVNGGCVVASKSATDVTTKVADSDSKAQHWTIEYGDGENVVAFQNVQEGKWLRAAAGHASAKVELGEQQWWTLEPGRAPGSCWIKCNDFKDAYLCNAWALHTPDNTVYMWPRQENWVHSMEWYTPSSSSSGFKPVPTGAGDKSTASDNSDTEAREKALSEKEAALAKKEAELNARSYENGQSSSSGPDREAALAKREKELGAAENSINTKRSAMDKREADVARREAALKRSTAEAGNGGGQTTATSSRPSEVDLLRSENEKLQLKLLIAELEKKLAANQKSPAVNGGNAKAASKSAEPAQAKAANTQFGSASAKGATEQEAARRPREISAKAGPSGDGTAGPSAANTGKRLSTPSKTEPKQNGKHMKSSPGAPKASNTSESGSAAHATPSEKSNIAPAKPSRGAVRPNNNTDAVTGQKDDFGLASELDRLKKENARLKQEQDATRKKSNGPVGASAGAAKSKAKPAGSTSGTTIKGPMSASFGKGGTAAAKGALNGNDPGIGGVDDQENELHAHCIHEVYPPPRKIGRRMIGIMYH